MKFVREFVRVGYIGLEVIAGVNSRRDPFTHDIELHLAGLEGVEKS